MRILSCFFAALLVGGDAFAEITRGPYLQLSHETGITVVWRSDQAMQSPEVRFWIEGSAEIQTCSGDAILERTLAGDEPLSFAPPGETQYEATITGLIAGTIYRYAVHEGDESLAAVDGDYYFTTHPLIGESTPARIWVVGDSGTGEAHQRLVHEGMLKYTLDAGHPIDLYLHVGDMAYGQGTDEQFQSKFFEPYQFTLENTVCWASMGNHEGKTSNGGTGVGPYFDAYVCPTKGEAGGVPSGDESYYSFDYGDIHFICLNSHDIERSPTGEMAKWLKRDLAATEAGWLVAFWHHPPYTKGTHDSDVEIQLVEMRQHIMPILEDGGVDIVLSGHSHIYERSMLIDGAYETPTTVEGVVLDDGDGDPKGDGAYRKSGEITPHNGTVAVVTGHGGALGRNSKGVMPIMRSIVLDHGSTLLDIDGDTLTGTMLDLYGKVRDQFQIVKRGTVAHTVIEKPWSATADTEERTGAGVLGAPGTVAAAENALQAGAKAVAKLLPEGAENLIAPNAVWDYLAGGEKPETEMWTKLGFDAREEEWKSGKAGFGYGDGDDRTELTDMRGNYTSIFIRRELEIPVGTDLTKIGLVINYDDGFVLHVNGREILSRFVNRDSQGKVTVTSHESSGAEYFPLEAFGDSFQIGPNVIALEGHNVSLTSSDLSLDPYLVLVPGE